jgi:hypothetical protein
MLNLAPLKGKTMLWLVSVAGVLLGAFGTVWSLVHIERIDNEMRRVDHLGVGLKLEETHRELARKYGLDPEVLRYPQWLTDEVIKILRKRRKTVVYIRAILITLGAIVAVGAIVYGNLRT